MVLSDAGKIPIFTLAVRVVAGSNPAAPTNQKMLKIIEELGHLSPNREFPAGAVITAF
jgi:hypothetical protein